MQGALTKRSLPRSTTETKPSGIETDAPLRGGTGVPKANLFGVVWEAQVERVAGHRNPPAFGTHDHAQGRSKKWRSFRWY